MMDELTPETVRALAHTCKELGNKAHERPGQSDYMRTFWRAEEALTAMAEENERLRKLVKAGENLYRATDFLADNDPDDIVCDGGGTAILVGLSGIRSALAAYRATEGRGHE